ncbi:polyribonucleotide nucleotidyltransferase [Deferribacter desulfuricans SSM1]|uniref:Polyribonucleotide nucleotidyltransferase n=1 Tax=Deferribacter desulfuricans (strain DSM 14783 / JCM 11476 / NBRC 101012 / SSM1) TaxID=639282 RepID=D3PEF7_DEFDS|nr:polyribonucleotide nucleotidyltransferase [Deferribacter desulfuricans]BAI80980.1 polyribonucleotide nucleotidyltransferase [Deferribacter desulfuricans SSM1]
MEKKIFNYEVKLTEDSEPIIFETGWKAKQANGSIWIKQGGSVVLVTAVASKEASENLDFFPLTVNYIEKFYAVGKIPGGFIKREGKPSDKETLISRLIDRPIRPLFPEGFRNETQIIATVVSSDQVNSTDILALNAASAALMISDIPFEGPIGAVRVGKINGEYVINPSAAIFDDLEMNIVVAGTEDSIVMVEAGMKNCSEEDVVNALEFGHEAIKKLVEVQKRMRDEIGKEKFEYMDFSVSEDDLNKLYDEIGDKLKEAVLIPGKLEKYEAIDKVKEEYFEKLKEELGDEFEENKGYYNELYQEVEKKVFRDITLNSGKRVDGRTYTEIRPIDIEVDLLPCAHGSALFTRGETQALVTATLGTKFDSQLLDDLEGETYKRFMLHYNFPPFSVGEIGFLRAPGRREIGHGFLAERALASMLPGEDEFPYTIRVVSEILESNGSSSMATVCGGSLALMDAGVPIKDVVAGIAMGLIYEGDDNYVILSDIMGIEDHLGDMDFKVTGTETGITALQMDIKIKGLKREILEKALAQAKEGRLFILQKMKAVLAKPREEVSPKAPRFVKVKINPEKVGLLIGPAGKTIKSIIDKTGVKIDILEEGELHIFGNNKEAIDSAIEMIEAVTQELTVGKIYNAKVKRVVDYGAFVELFPGVEGLLHVSQFSKERIENIRDHVKVGDSLDVEYLGKDDQGRIKLSRKNLV